MQPSLSSTAAALASARSHWSQRRTVSPSNRAPPSASTQPESKLAHLPLRLNPLMQDLFTRTPDSKLDGFSQYQVAAQSPSHPQAPHQKESPRRMHLVPSPIQVSSETKSDLIGLVGPTLPSYRPPAPPGGTAASCRQGTGQTEYCTACFMTGIRPLQTCMLALLAPVVEIPHAATVASQWRALCSGVGSKRSVAGMVMRRSACSDEQFCSLMHALLANQHVVQLQLLELDSLQQCGQAASDMLAGFLLQHSTAEHIACLRLTGCERMFTASRSSAHGFSMLPHASNVLPSAARTGAPQTQQSPQRKGTLQGRLGDHVAEAMQMDEVGNLRPVMSHMRPSFVRTGLCAPAGTAWPEAPARPVQALPTTAAPKTKSKTSRSTSSSRRSTSGSLLSRGGGLQLSQLEPDMLQAVKTAEANEAGSGRKQGSKRGKSQKGRGTQAATARPAQPELHHQPQPPHSPLHPAGVLTHAIARRCTQLAELDMSNNKISPAVALSVVLPPLLVPESQVFASISTLSFSWNSMGPSAVLLCFLLLNKRLTPDSIQAFSSAYILQQRKRDDSSGNGSSSRSRGQRATAKKTPLPPTTASTVVVTEPQAVTALTHTLARAMDSASVWSAACEAVDVSRSAQAGSGADYRAVQNALQRAALAADLSQAGKFNSSLAYLELSMCAIDDSSGALLLHCACGSETLRSLDLSHNALGPLSAAAAERLVVNSDSLLSLDLGFNPLGWEGTVRLVQALQANDSVVELSVENTLVQTQFHSTLDGSVPRAWHLPQEATPAPPMPATRTSMRSTGSKASGGSTPTRQPKTPQKSQRSMGAEADTAEAAPSADEVPTPPSHSEAYQMLHEICTGILSRRGTYAQVNFEYPPQHRLMGTFKYAHLTRSASGRWLGLQAEREAGDWSLQRSVWRPRLLESDSRAFFDTQSIMNRAFEADVHCSKMDRMLKDPEQLSNLKVKLRRRFPALRELFRYYCCSGGSAASGIDPFSMSFQQFTEWRRDSGIEATNLTQHLDMAFIAANSSLPGQGAGDPTASDRRLRRHEFLEAVIRTAMVMFPPDMTDADGPAASVSRLMEHHVLPTVSSLLNVTDPSEPWSNSWRRTRLYTQPVDRVLKLYLPTLRDIFDRCSRTVNTNELTHLTSAGFSINTKQRAARSHEETQDTQRLYRKRFLFLEPFIALVQSAGCMKNQSGGDAGSLYQAWLARKTGKQQTLEGQSAADKAAELVFTKRDAMSVFVFSSMTVVSEVQRDLRSCRRCLHNSLTFTGFLEAVARLADSSACPSPQDVMGTGSQAHLKGSKPSSAAATARAAAGKSLSTGAGALQQTPEEASGLNLEDAVSVATSGGDSSDSLDPSTPPEELERRLPLVITVLARGAQVPIQLSSNLED